MSDKMRIPLDGLLLAIYSNGKMLRTDMSAADMRSIGQQLIAMADGVMIRGTMPKVENEQKENER